MFTHIEKDRPHTHILRNYYPLTKVIPACERSTFYLANRSLVPVKQVSAPPPRMACVILAMSVAFDPVDGKRPRNRNTLMASPMTSRYLE